MKLLLGLWQASAGNEIVTEHCYRFGIEYTEVDTWNCDLQYHCIPYRYLQNIESWTLIICPNTLHLMLGSEIGQNTVVAFLGNRNKIIVWNDIDANNLLDKCRRCLEKIDHEIRAQAITWVSDAPLSDRHWIHRLQGVNIETRPLSTWFRFKNFVPSCYKKNPTCKDFLLMTVLKKNKPYRALLLDMIYQRPALLSNSLIVVRKRNDDNFIAMDMMLPVQDFYINSWFEIVPEARYKGAYYVTEKTIKSLMTMTPFLSLAQPYFLTYLQTLGFKTFGHLIDESYDQEFDYKKRVEKIVQQVESIVQNGSQSFYNASYDVLEHNLNRLYELSGKWHNLSNEFLKTVLTNHGVADQTTYFDNRHLAVDKFT